MNEIAECVLCRLVRGLEDRSLVLEDDESIALMTIEPVDPGHTLVVPKRHVPLIGELDEDVWLHTCSVARRVEGAIRRSDIRSEGTNLFIADGEAAFQEVPHVHIHVFPRFAGDGFKIESDWSARPSRTELDHAASSIREATARRHRDISTAP